MTDGPRNESAPEKSSTGRRRPRKGMTIADYEIGRGKTDKRTWWKKDDPSPNPKGRPRKPKPGTRDLDYFLAQTVSVPGAKGPEIYTKRELGNLQIANHFAKGVPWALKLVGLSETKGSEIEDPLLFDESLAREIIAEATRDLRKAKSKRPKKDDPE